MKVAVVTGASRGIGKAIADALTSEGYKVVIADVMIDESNPDAVRCDISSSEDRKNLLAVVMEKYGRVDLLVNNAGVACRERKDILVASEESFDRLININLKGTFFMCQTFANGMIECLNKGLEDYSPRIINTSSVSAYAASTERGEYCISKAGIAMTTQLFALKLAEYGIPVFEVRPGIIRTDMTACVTEKYDNLIANGITPIKRWGEGSDVADCVLAAASGKLDFGTGTVLNADGGFHLRKL